MRNIVERLTSDGKSSDGGRLLQVTNTCEAAVGERVQCCDRENSKRAFVRSEDADGSAIARLASFEGKSIRGVAPMMLATPTAKPPRWNSVLLHAMPVAPV